jgi:hypothetical protein
MKEEERFTGPAKPAEFIAVEPDGRLPSAIVALAFEPELNVKLFPLSWVMLKSCGLTTTVTLFARV